MEEKKEKIIIDGHLEPFIEDSKGEIKEKQIEDLRNKNIEELVKILRKE